MHGAEPKAMGMLINAAYGFVYAVVGGYITGLLAPSRAMTHVYWLVGLTVVMGAVSVYLDTSTLPLWYWVLIVVVGALGIALGGSLYERRAATENAR
jgi:uncharacterized membrane protein HdeD (DUF308 family)